MEYVALLGIALLFGLSIFQIALIFGAPFGEFAWGGKHKVLPKSLRGGSVISTALYGIFALFLASKVGFINVTPHSSFLTIGMWVFTVYFFIGILMNLLSKSKKERYVMTPVAAALAVVFLLVSLTS